MKCSKCGAELSEDTKFCSYCGQKIEESTTPPPIVEETEIPPIPNEEPVIENSKKSDAPKSLADKIRDKASGKWSKLSTYGKITTVAFVAFTLLCLVAFLFGKTAAAIIAVLQIVLTVVAVLMKRQIIKTPKNWLHIIALALAIVLLVPYVSLFKVDYGDAEKFKWSDILLADVVPEPESLFGEIISNHDDYLSLYVYKTSIEDYNDYVEACKEKGFTVEADQSEQSYYAYDAGGYKLSLDYDESDSKMHIGIEAAEEYGTLVWSDSEIASMLPVPTSTTGEITQDDETGFQAYVSNTSIDEFKTYATACADKGFDIDAYDTDKSYSAENSEGYKLSVSYQGNNVMSVSVDEPEYNVSIEIECVENLLFSTYDVDVYIDDMFEGTIEHGATETFEVTMTKGTYEVKFENAEDDEVTGTVTIDIQKDETLKYKISCTSSKISVETIVGTAGNSDDETSDNTKETIPPESEVPKITVTMSEDDFIGMLYTDAEAKLREMGFTVFEYETLETEDINKPDDTIGAVEIKNWTFGKGDFAVGDTYEADAIVVLWYYICDEPEPNLTVDNCPELAAILSNKAEIDDSYSAFATKYKGRVIEFDGRIDYCTKHEDYKTRFDYLVSAGDYDPDHQIGPSFKFENVAYYDLNTNLDTVSVGLNVRIVAEVVSFDSNSGLFYLDPVSVTGR